ncbi:ATP-binding protein [Streptomyces abyssalis]|uniref:ATP-binding protein n=1 Tax=Streptomyces abyssalis TaxID=933944 RepID=UPI0030B8021A
MAAPRFAMRFTSTPRGARLARRLVARRLADWGHPYGSETNETMTLIAGELAANAVRHGHVPGRDFRLALTAAPDVLRIEVTDTRGELRPACRVTGPDAESGRGLLLVSQLAERWAVTTAGPTHPGKTVWAEVPTAPAPPRARPDQAAAPSGPR